MGVKLQERASGKPCLGDQVRPLVSLGNTRGDMGRKRRYNFQDTELPGMKICSAVTNNHAQRIGMGHSHAHALCSLYLSLVTRTVDSLRYSANGTSLVALTTG